MQGERGPGSTSPAPRRARTGLPWGAAILVLVVGGVWWLSTPTAFEQTALRRYPELWGVPRRTEARFRPFLARWSSERRAAGLPEEDPTEADLAAAVRAAGPDAVRAAVRAWIAWNAGGRWSFDFDDEGARFAPSVVVALRDVATPADDALLLRVLRDRAVSLDTRLNAASVLCRPGDAAALAPLTDFVLDPSEDSDCRAHVLCGLPRIGGPLPARLADLLDRPAGDLDVTAACVLGATGDPVEAPSLVAAALAQRREMYPPHVRHALVVVRRLAGDDPEVAEPLETVEREWTDRSGGSEAWDVWRADLRRLHDAFAAWLDRHPEALDTPWERRRRADAATPARERTRRIRTVEDVLATPDADLDVAVVAAALTVKDGAEVAEELAADLDRVARRIRPAVARAATPREKLAVLRAALVPAEAHAPFAPRIDTAWSALRWRGASCVGWTLAFVGIGHRLGLPLRSVSVPRHMFVRWDDGKARIHLDPSFDGASWSDDEVVRKFGVPDTPAGRAAHLRSLTPRETLALALTNAAGRSSQDDADAALALADAALRLDPASVAAHMLRAVVLAQRGDRAAVVAAAEAGEALPTFVPSDAGVVAKALSDAGEDDLALALLDRHPPLGPERADLLAARVTALVRSGRADAAYALADDLLRPHGGEVTCAAAGVLAAFASGGPERADAAFDTALRRGCAEAGLTSATVARLIDARSASHRSARYALDLLARGEAGRAGGDGGRTRSIEQLTDPATAVDGLRGWLLNQSLDELRTKAAAVAEDPSVPEER